QRVGAVRRADAVLRAAEAGEVALEIFDQRAADERRRSDGRAKHRDQLLLEVEVRRGQVKKGDAVHRQIVCPRAFRDCSAASSSRTTRSPAAPSLEGHWFLRMQSMKAPSSSFSASV